MNANSSPTYNSFITHALTTTCITLTCKTHRKRHIYIIEVVNTAYNSCIHVIHWRLWKNKLWACTRRQSRGSRPFPEVACDLYWALCWDAGMGAAESHREEKFDILTWLSMFFSSKICLKTCNPTWEQNTSLLRLPGWCDQEIKCSMLELGDIKVTFYDMNFPLKHSCESHHML